MVLKQTQKLLKYSNFFTGVPISTCLKIRLTLKENIEGSHVNFNFRYINTRDILIIFKSILIKTTFVLYVFSVKVIDYIGDCTDSYLHLFLTKYNDDSVFSNLMKQSSYYTF